MLRALEHGGKCDVEGQPLRLQLAGGFPGLGNPLLGEIGSFQPVKRFSSSIRSGHDARAREDGRSFLDFRSGL